MQANISELTKGTVDGNGAFDVLMRTVDAHLTKEYHAERITGSDYTQVYLGALTAVLQQAANYLLQSEHIKKQIALIEAQIKNMDKNTDLINAQIRKMDAEVLVTQQQVLLMKEQIAHTIQQTRLVTQQVLNAEKEMLIADQQILKSEAEVKLIDQQVINAVSQNTAVLKSITKMDSEIKLLDQKLVTEKAQTTGTKESIGGLSGMQMILFEKQAEGFDRNAEQKLAKMLIDTWTVRQTTDGAMVDKNGLSDNEINRVLNKAKEGLKLAPFNG